MLDDLKMIHQKDTQDALGIAEKQWQQLTYEFSVPTLKKPEAVVFSGMGGSALAAQLALTWPGCAVPFIVSRDYSIPQFVNQATLFIASSYSGNTEETLESLSRAEERGASIVVIASGGKLADIANQNNYPLILLPKASQPRYATLYSFKALVSIFVACELLDANYANEQLGQASEWVKQSTANWRPDVATKENIAKKIALDCVGKNVVVYGGPLTYPAAYKWKISFNENAKNIAWVNQYPEFNHNEFMGWTSHPLDKPYVVLDLRSNLEHPQILKRFKVSEKLLSGKRPAPMVIEAEGSSVLGQLLWLVALGDFVSLYTALLNGLNPTPVDLIETFKKEIA